MQKLAKNNTFPAIFLDRDGTLNDDIGYLYQQEKWRWLEDAPKALAIFVASGYELIVVSNQSGIARGLYNSNDVDILHEFVNADLRRLGYNFQIKAFYFCPHHPDFTGKCSCRKPAPDLLLTAAKDFNIDLSRSWMIGDKFSDVEAGLNAGCQALLLGTANNQHERHKAKSVPFANTLLEASQYICGL